MSGADASVQQAGQCSNFPISNEAGSTSNTAADSMLDEMSTKHTYETAALESPYDAFRYNLFAIRSL